MLNKLTGNEKIKERRLIRTGFLTLFVSFCLLAGVCCRVFANGCVNTCSGHTYWEQIYCCFIHDYTCGDIRLEALRWTTAGNCCSGGCRVKSVAIGVVTRIYNCHGDSPNPYGPDCEGSYCSTTLAQEFYGQVPVDFGCTCCDPPCNADTCQSCVNCICKPCGGNPNQHCCSGNCCPGECCEGETTEPLCNKSNGCGCDPAVGGSCSDKKERQPAGGGPFYYTYGTVSC
jgi:hypothetical protein